MKSAPALILLAHSDLRRVGEVALLPLDHPLTLGRGTPLFERRQTGGHAAPLDDPCISNNQLTLELTSGDLLSAKPSTSSRRQVMFLKPGTPRSGTEATTLRPGSLIAIGDRILLRYALVPLDMPSSRWEMIGHSPLLSDLYASILRAGDLAQLVVGETGTGKELVARALHASSPRAAHPFVSLNCATIPRELAESTFFGHARGAYTGATSERDGLFKTADQGTIFLDEIGEMPLELQAKLLRVLEEKRFRPVGRDREIDVNIRVIAATNRDLEQEVKEGRFRGDLFHRLGGRFPLRTAPLRERSEDIPLLFARFLSQNPELAPLRCFQQASTSPPLVPVDFFLRLMEQPWPGNIRELHHLADRSFAGDRFVGVERLDSVTAAPTPPRKQAPTSGSLPRSRKPDQKELLRLLQEHGSDRRVAVVLGVSHVTVGTWRKEYGILVENGVSD